MRKPEMLCHCGSAAMRKVGSRGWCWAHESEAFKAAAIAKQQQQSIAGLLALDHERRVRDVGELATRRHRS